MGISGVAVLVFKYMPNPLHHLRNPYLYMVLTFILCAANFGGTPFNLINNPPFIYADPRSGRIVWYIRAARSQLKLEGWLVGASSAFKYFVFESRDWSHRSARRSYRLGDGSCWTSRLGVEKAKRRSTSWFGRAFVWYSSNHDAVRAFPFQGKVWILSLLGTYQNEI